MNRETRYVAMTRGRHSNSLYVATDFEVDPDTAHGPAERQTAREVLTAILTNHGVDLSAHETIRAAHDAATSWAQLIAEYDTIAAFADHDYWARRLKGVLPPSCQERLRESDAYGPLVTALRRVDALDIDVAATIRMLVSERELDTVDDVAGVLHNRVERWLAATNRLPVRDRLIGGLRPTVRDVTDPDMQRALAERADLLEHRARTLAEQALADRADWVRPLGPPPSDPAPLGPLSAMPYNGRCLSRPMERHRPRPIRHRRNRPPGSRSLDATAVATRLGLSHRNSVQGRITPARGNGRWLDRTGARGRCARRVG